MNNSTNSFLPEARSLRRVSIVLSLIPGLTEEQKQQAAIQALGQIYEGLDPAISSMLAYLSRQEIQETSLSEDSQANDLYRPVSSVVPLSPTDWFDTEIGDRQIDLHSEYSVSEVKNIMKTLSLKSPLVSKDDLNFNLETEEAIAQKQELTWRFFTDKEKLTAEEIEDWDSYHDRVRAGKRQK